MKLENKKWDQDDIQIEKKQFERKEHFVKRLNPHLSHKVFEYNKATGELNEAQFYNIPTITWEDAVKQNYAKYRKIAQRENCIYFSCLNLKNAVKVLKRDFNIKYNNANQQK